MPDVLFAGKTAFKAHAIFLAERLDLSTLDLTGQIGASPLVVKAGANGCAVLFRYGAVVLFGMEPAEESTFLAQVRLMARDPHEPPEEEAAEIQIDSSADERIATGALILHDPSVERLQLVADCLAESTVLHHYEEFVSATFDRVEPLAASLEQGKRGSRRSRHLLRHIGAALLMEHRMVGRIEVAEKPEVLWDHMELEPLYARLAGEYELRERQAAINRKLEVISRTVQTVLDLLQNRRSLRVEWYIVALIVFEILLSLYELFLK